MNNPNIIKNLKNEIPGYVSNADAIGEGVDPIHWWKPNEAELPHWSSAAKMVLLGQPLLTESERVFSILTMSFGHVQDISMQDYGEYSLMSQFN